MEASALHVSVGRARGRSALGSSLLRLRSDEQLVAQFRDGNDEAFHVIHDRYRQRLFAYTRQMFPGSRQDAEDAVQDVFLRAYSGLRADDRDLALRAWLYRVAHNRCIDQLRQPPMPAPELFDRVRATIHDPIAEAEQRESLRRLIADVRRLPEQQRSALLMRELGGMTYDEVSRALGVTVPAVKSLLVRARISLAQAAESRDTPCCEIREELTMAHDRRIRPSAAVRRHLRDCAACSDFREALRGTSRQFAALIPALGPVGVLANLLGIGGGGSGGMAATGALGGGAAAAGGATLISAGHVATILAAAAVTTGGALEIQHTIAASAPSVQLVTPWSTSPAAGARPVGVFPVAAPGRVTPGSTASGAALTVPTRSSALTPASSPVPASRPKPTPMLQIFLTPPSRALNITNGAAASAPGATNPGSGAAASNSGGSATSQPTTTTTTATTATTTASTPSGASPPSSSATGSSTGSPSSTPAAADAGAAPNHPTGGSTDVTVSTTASPAPAAPGITTH